MPALDEFDRTPVGSEVSEMPVRDALQYQAGIHHSNQLLQLELENIRLQRLVAELLLKNQQLRQPD